MRCSSTLLIIALTVCGCDKFTQTTPSGDTIPAGDNSAINQRDRNVTAKTPLDQNENRKDIDITAEIRRQVVDTKMSVNAQNVKIMTQDGKVTLRGPVATAEEKSAIETIARKVAGESMVDNQLDVTPAK
jgi:hyperosmotically inducible protein